MTTNVDMLMDTHMMALVIMLLSPISVRGNAFVYMSLLWLSILELGCLLLSVLTSLGTNSLRYITTYCTLLFDQNDFMPIDMCIRQEAYVVLSHNKMACQ